MSSASQRRYAIVVPVKPPAVAKSRLAPLGEEVRRDLVVAFAKDTVAAALASELVAAVLVVTDDHALAADLWQDGAEVIPDGTADDLNGSLVQAAAEVGRRWPDLSVAVLCADLPALRPEELSLALQLADPARQSFVADASGEGTTMLAAPSWERVAPRFGGGSRAAHLDAGAAEILDPGIRSLRRDVDTPADLAEARGLGVGDYTVQVARGHRL